MTQLAEPALLRAWEAGQGRHPVDQALAMLALALPETSRDELASLPVGRRDAHLLAIYERTFGSHIEGLVDCPQCGNTLEFSLLVADIQQPPAAEMKDHIYRLSAAGYQLQFRLPNSFDLAAIALPAGKLPALQADSDLTPVRDLLIQRCLVQATLENEPVRASDLPEPVIDALVREMAAYDPQAEVQFNFTCPDCAHGWQALFDIVTFLWARISAQGQRLLQEVHALARAYGWSEADILAMSNARRQYYLSQVT